MKSVATSDEQLDVLATPKTPSTEPAKTRCSQLTELPGTAWEEMFACHIDESAGLAEETA